MTADTTTCLGCHESVAPGAIRFSSRVRVEPHGELPGGFVCVECHQLATEALRDGREDTADERLEWAKGYGLGLGGGWTGAAGPG